MNAKEVYLVHQVERAQGYVHRHVADVQILLLTALSALHKVPESRHTSVIEERIEQAMADLIAMTKKVDQVVDEV